VASEHATKQINRAVGRGILPVLRPICPRYLRDYNSRCVPLRWPVKPTLSRFACVNGSFSLSGCGCYAFGGVPASKSWRKTRSPIDLNGGAKYTGKCSIRQTNESYSRRSDRFCNRSESGYVHKPRINPVERNYTPLQITFEHGCSIRSGISMTTG